MPKMHVNIFLKLWDDVRGWRTDSKFAEFIGIEPSTVSFWRKGRTKTVNPEIIGMIEKKLNCRVRLTNEGRWDVRYLSDDLLSAADKMNDNTERADKMGSELMNVLKKYDATDPNVLARSLWCLSAIRELLRDENHADVTEDFANSEKLKRDKK